MDSSGDVKHPRRIKRSGAALILQIVVYVFVLNVPVVSSLATSLFLWLTIVVSSLSLAFAVHAASGEDAGFWWILPLAPVCTFLIFLKMAFSAFYVPGS